MDGMDVDLSATLLGGQCFSWKEHEGCYQSVCDGRLVTIGNQQDIIDQGLSSYFDMDFPYEEAGAYLASLSSVLAEAISLHPGLHILRQSQWVATISFIMSQNNNIKRITSMYDTLCRTYGRHVIGDWYTFPDREELSRASEKELRELHFGYRSGYIVKAVQEFSEIGDDVPTQKARRLLIDRSGIGPKVADCILLYGCHRMDVFPLDTWMKKVMARYFPNKEPEIFHPYQALAQQFLFQAAQSGVLPC